MACTARSFASGAGSARDWGGQEDARVAVILLSEGARWGFMGQLASSKPMGGVALPVGVARVEFCEAFHYGKRGLKAVERIRRLPWASSTSPMPNNLVIHTELEIGRGLVMLGAATPQVASKPPAADGSSPIVLHVYLENVERVMEKAAGGGG